MVSFEQAARFGYLGTHLPRRRQSSGFCRRPVIGCQPGTTGPRGPKARHSSAGRIPGDARAAAQRRVRFLVGSKPVLARPKLEFCQSLKAGRGSGSRINRRAGSAARTVGAGEPADRITQTRHRRGGGASSRTPGGTGAATPIELVAGRRGGSTSVDGRGPAKRRTTPPLAAPGRPRIRPCSNISALRSTMSTRQPPITPFATAASATWWSFPRNLSTPSVGPALAFRRLPLRHAGPAADRRSVPQCAARLGTAQAWSPGRTHPLPSP